MATSTNAQEAFPGFKFGCDPELFIIDGEGEFVCADGIIPGTKDAPYKVPFGAVQVDGMAAEFNTDPVSSFEEFDHNIVQVLKSLKSYLPKSHKLVAVPSATFSEKVWNAAPDNAKVLGCTPDFNAWTGTTNPPPNDPTNPTLRTASGHIHIGWRDDGDSTDPSHVGHCQDLVKQLDYYLGAWSLAQDADPVRRRLYGKAGACRYKPYGVEYRVLSNFWVSNKDMRRQVWNRTQKALFDMQSKYAPGQYGGDYNNYLVESINTSQLSSLLERAYRFPINNL